MEQCKGTTVKGVRCKARAEGGYCRHHIHSSGSVVRDSFGTTVTGSTKVATKRPGYIYIYTLSKLVASEPIQVKNLPDAKSKHRDSWVAFDPKKSAYHLLKIGMTTSTVEKRLKQWEAQCNHKVTSVFPGVLDSARSNPLSEVMAKFKNMSLIGRRDSQYSTFQNNGFVTKHDVASVEHKIHKELRSLYGNGTLYCRGCAKEKDSSFKSFNIHTEWFLIPKKDLNDVFKLVDRNCK